MTHLAPAAEAMLDAAARLIVPELASADEATWQRFHATVDDALGEREPGVRRQFAVFLRLLDLLAVVRFGRLLEKLDVAKQQRLLSWLQDASPSLLRKGFWGLKTLVFMGYYAQPDVAASLGYRPSFDGNERLHA